MVDTSSPIVFAGAGFAGLTAALSLSRFTNRPPIVLIEPKENFIFYPLLFELLSSEVESWEVSLPYKSILINRGISLLHDSVSLIDTENQEIHTSLGSQISYSQLVISTGSKPNYYDIPGAKQHSYNFNTIEDVHKLKNLINNLSLSKDKDKQLVIVGGGSTGIELACKISDLTKRAIKISIIELNHKILSLGKFFNQEQSQLALTKRSINLILNSRVLSVAPDTVTYKSLINKKNQNLVLSHLGVIWTAGRSISMPRFHPELEFREGRIAVNSQLKVIGFDNIFAIGDVSFNELEPYPFNAQVATQQGQTLSKILMENIDSGLITTSFSFKDYGEMLSLGIGDAVITSNGFNVSGKIAFKFRRMFYIQRNPSLSFALRSATSWLLRN